MKINSDFKDLLQSLNAGTRYLIVGGYAVMAHTEPRYTKDLDFWIEPDPENAARTITALAQFGAPVAASDFTEPQVFFHIGIEPGRRDVRKIFWTPEISAGTKRLPQTHRRQIQSPILACPPIL